MGDGKFKQGKIDSIFLIELIKSKFGPLENGRLLALELTLGPACLGPQPIIFIVDYIHEIVIKVVKI